MNSEVHLNREFKKSLSEEVEVVEKSLKILFKNFFMFSWKPGRPSGMIWPRTWSVVTIMGL